MNAVNTRNPTSTSAPTVTSCLYVRSMGLPVGLGLRLDQGHLEIALHELLHRRIARLEDLLGLPHRADLRLPQERDAVRHAERAAHVVRHYHARHSQLVLQPKIRAVGKPE